MSEPIKVEAAQAEIPGTAPKADETKTAAAEPARDWSAELKAAQTLASKAEKRAKELEAKHAESSGVLEKLRAAFGPGDQAVDPVTRVKELEAKHIDAVGKFKNAVLRNALTEKLVLNKVQPELLDHALRLVDVEGVDIDDAGKINNGEAIDAAVGGFKEKFGKVYFVQDAPAVEATRPGVPSSTVPKHPGQPAAGKPMPELTADQIMTMPMEEVRKWKAAQLMRHN